MASSGGSGEAYGRCEVRLRTQAQGSRGKALKAVNDYLRLALLASWYVRPKAKGARRRLYLSEFMFWDAVQVYEKRFGVPELPVTVATMRTLLKDYAAGGGWANFCEHDRKAFIAAVKGIEKMDVAHELKDRAKERAKPVLPGDVDGLILAQELSLA